MISAAIVVSLAAGLVGGTLALSLAPRLGLDLQGGLSVILTAPEGTRADVLDKTVEVLRNRVDRAGVAEPEVFREGGSNNIVVQLPGSGEETRRLLDLIGQTAQLQFRQVLEEVDPVAPEYASLTVSEKDDPELEVVLLDAEEIKYRMAPAALTGESVRRATAVLESNSLQEGWLVSVNFDREGNRNWSDFTGKLACEPVGSSERRAAIVLDGRVESSPQVGEDVQCDVGITGGSTQITGQFTEDEARDLALVLTAGALPVSLEQSQVRIISPTLGRDSLNAGLLAGALGLGLVMLYVLFYYRSLGLQAWLGLSVFGLIIYGLVVVLGELIEWNLTLAGIAGLIVSVGIATDSNIVLFERIKEEVHEGMTLRTSVDRGFGHAWRTLKAANFVTILAAITLYFLAVGPVKGFALALGMATTLDLFITFVLTWPVAALIARSRFLGEGRFLGMRRALEGKASGPMRKFVRSEFNIDFIGKRKLWFAVSSAALIVCAAALLPAIRGLDFGIDFQGGTIFRIPSERTLDVADVKAALADVGQPDAVVQIVTDPDTKESGVQVQMGALPADQRSGVSEALSEVTGTDESEVTFEAVGEKWGAQITTKALRGLVIFLVLVVLYMTWRLELKMAIAGITALFHDLLLTAGLYAIVGFEVSPATIIATLTILGYSLYDTVVVFDKVRENAESPSHSRKPFAEIGNLATNQVLMRSINTSLTTLLPVGSLLFVGSGLLGADTLKDLALALFVGIAAGTYSSIFVAVPVLSVLKEREGRYAVVKESSPHEERQPAEVVAKVEPVEPKATAKEQAAQTPVGPRKQRKRLSRSKRKKKRR